MRNGVRRRDGGVRVVQPSRLGAKNVILGVSKELIRLGNQELGSTVTCCRRRPGLG